jgi:hypothetical protein
MGRIMRKRQVLVLVAVDCLILTVILIAYFTRSLNGVNRGLIGLALGLPIVANLAYFSERSKIRFFTSVNPPSICNTHALEDEKNYPTEERIGFGRTSEKTTSQRDQRGWSHAWEILTVLLILAAASVEYFVGNVSLRLLGPIAALGISAAMTGFSLHGNFWRPKWADASPGINLVRCTIVGLVCLAALTVLYMGVGAWLGTVEAAEINKLFLKAIMGLTMVGYYSRRIANSP